MAIALVQSAKGTSAVATNNPAFSVAPASGNLVVLAFTSDDYNGTPDTGWTQSANMEIQGFHGGYIWWQISNGSNPPGSYTIGSATNSAWVMMEFSGCAATPYDTSVSQFTNTSAINYTTPNITPSTGNRVLVAMIGGSLAGSMALLVITTWLNSFNAIDSSGSGGAGTNDLCGTAYRLVTGDGSTTFSTGGTYGGTGGTPQSRSGLLISFNEAAGVNTIMFADQARS